MGKCADLIVESGSGADGLGPIREAFRGHLFYAECMREAIAAVMAARARGNSGLSIERLVRPADAFTLRSGLRLVLVALAFGDGGPVVQVTALGSQTRKELDTPAPKPLDELPQAAKSVIRKALELLSPT